LIVRAEVELVINLQRIHFLQKNFKMKFSSFPLLLLTLCGCSEKKSQCGYTLNVLLENFSSRVFGTNNINGFTSEYRDRAKDSIVGGYYEFYPTGLLKSYHFFVNMETYVYKEEFDNTGKLIHTEGNPNLYYFIKMDSDSLLIKMRV
jgi:hypothetical protein